jgi:putative restriction endonuclease
MIRADIHTLFDLGLLSIDPSSMRIAIAPALRGTQYEALDGSAVRLPADKLHRPNKEAFTNVHWPRGNVD